jgi:cytochrome P450
MLNLFTDDVRRNPYPLYARLRAAGWPVMRDPQSGMTLVFSYDAVKRVLLDPDRFSSAASPDGGQPLDWLIFKDPPRHTKLRAIMSRAFTPRSVANLESRVAAFSKQLLDAAIDRGTGRMDLAADYAVQLPIMVIAEMIGIPLEDRPRFKRWSDGMLALAETMTGTPDEVGRAVDTYVAIAGEMAEYLPALVEARRASPRDDLLTRLVEAEVEGERLTSKELRGFVQLLLLAGSETTTNLIGNAMLCFTEHPGQLARVRERPELIPSAIEEVLRYRSPLQIVFRQARNDVVLDGQAIPAGKMVLVVIGSANRDPAQFDRADEFDVARDPNPHLAFGHGIHFCLGAALARLEARIAIPDLLQRLGKFSLADDGPWEPRRAFHVHGPTRLPIRFEPE